MKKLKKVLIAATGVGLIVFAGAIVADYSSTAQAQKDSQAAANRPIVPPVAPPPVADPAPAPVQAPPPQQAAPSTYVPYFQETPQYQPYNPAPIEVNVPVQCNTTYNSIGSNTTCY